MPGKAEPNARFDPENPAFGGLFVFFPGQAHHAASEIWRCYEIMEMRSPEPPGSRGAEDATRPRRRGLISAPRLRSITEYAMAHWTSTACRDP